MSTVTSESTAAAPKVSINPFCDPAVRAKGTIAARLAAQKRREERERLKGEPDNPLPAGLQNQVIRRGASIVLDEKTGIKEQVQALSAVAKLTERLDTSNDFATQELVDYFRSIPR